MADMLNESEIELMGICGLAAKSDGNQTSAYKRYTLLVGPKKVIGLLKELDAARFAAEAHLACLTGEQLYAMVTSRFKAGSFPWRFVAASGKEAWEAAAAQLVFEADSVNAKLASQVQLESIEPGTLKRGAFADDISYSLYMDKLHQSEVREWHKLQAKIAQEQAQPTDLSLPELAEQFATVAELGCNYVLTAASCAKLFAAMTTPPEAAQPQAASVVPEWISVTERLPIEDELVLICGPIPPDVVSKYSHWRTCARVVQGSFLNANGCTQNSATHWTPLPPNPGANPAAPAIQAQPLTDAGDLMLQLLVLHQQFSAQGWRDMFECPTDTEVEFMEFGSTGIHKGTRLENGDVFLAPDGDFSYPILWRAIDHLAGDAPAEGA